MTTGSDPLGLTPEQRTEGEMLTLSAEFLDRIQENIRAWDALPPGTLIKCPHCPCYHSVEHFRG